MKQILGFAVTILLIANSAYAQKKKTTSTPPPAPQHKEEHKMETHHSSSAKEPSIFATSLKEVNVNFSSGKYESGKNSSVITLAGDFHLLIKPQIQAGGQAVVQSSSGSSTSGKTYMGFYAMGSYNLDASNIHNSIFFRGGLGLVDAGLAGSGAVSGTATSDTEKKFSIKAVGGKRIKMWEHIDYTPYGEIEKIGDFDPIIRIVPLSVSILY